MPQPTASSLVPDMREPHRPATGLVTDPAVVTAIADRIAAETDSTIEVLAREGRHFDLETTSQYLGYGPLLDRESVQLRSITKETDTIELWKHIEGEAVTVDIPEPLLEGDIIPVPTLRPARDGGLAGVTKLLGRTTDPDLYAPATLTATVAIIDPPIAVLDATTTFAGEPVATDALIAGPPFDVDAVGEQLLGRDGQAVGTTDIDAVTVRCDDVDLETVEGAIPSGDYPTTGHSRMLSKGYRLYSRLTG
ncbi:MAG: hypothetical protein U5K37_00815 [Natrialbaceae archaeon]|nr:hypothetical protein [Natrialbaceae archaeon]